VKPIVAFVAGVAAGAVAVIVFLAGTESPDTAGVRYWQQRAGDAESELAATRRRLLSATNQLESLSSRFDTLSARLEALTAAAAATPERQTTVVPALFTPAPAPTAAATVVSGASTPTPEFQAVSDEEWTALVRGTLHSEIERRLGGALPPEREQRLMQQLERLRDASRSLVEENLAPTDEERTRQDLMRTVVLMQADRVFREELGVGVAEFLRSLHSDQVEEIPPAGP
jgi:hypothetical protein